MILLRSVVLPLVVDRDLRVEYIDSLEGADLGSLTQIASMFARLERNEILRALSVDADVELSHQQSLTSAVIGALADKFSRRKEQKVAKLRQVNSLALTLRGRAEATLALSLKEITKAVAELSAARIDMYLGGTDRGSAHWYKSEVLQSAKNAHKFVIFAEDHYFTKGSIRIGPERLVFVVSFHHVGRELSGFMEATAFSKLESFEGEEDRESMSESFFLCSVEPFVFTHLTQLEDVVASFELWLDAALAIGLKEFADRL